MDWAPEEFHGLVSDESAEMRELHMHRVEYDAFRWRRAFGAQFTALIQLQNAKRYFGRLDGGRAMELAPIAAALDAVTPSFAEFASNYQRPKRKGMR